MPYFWILICFSLMTDNTQSPETCTVQQISKKDYLMGKFDPAVHPDFAKIPKKYADRPGLYLRKEVLEAYYRMYKAAAQDGIQLTIVSATRNFDYQKGIWENKWAALQQQDLTKKHPSDDLTKAKKILKYSAMPGASRHHWGTDIDLCNLNSSYFSSKSGKKIYDWLQKYASQYGFCQTYTSKKDNDRTGYNEEKWHWSYQPTSKVFTEEAATLLQDSDFTGFSGAQTALELNIVSNYVLGINKDCL